MIKTALSDFELLIFVDVMSFIWRLKPSIFGVVLTGGFLTDEADERGAAAVVPLAGVVHEVHFHTVLCPQVVGFMGIPVVVFTSLR